MIKLLAFGLAITVTYFAVTWAISVRIRNYGLLDVAFSYGVAILAPTYAWFGPGVPVRKWVFAGIGMVWSVRLGTHILVRVLKNHPVEDARYLTLRARWPGPWQFLGFFQLQAGLAVIFSLPFLFTAFNLAPTLSWLEIAGMVLAAAAVLGEAIADRQLQTFKRDPANRGQLCDVGLWRYSRHPNYFFESMVWWGAFLVALASPWGWVTIACPLLMLYFLFKVTGIPLTEEYAMKSKPDAYREYQRTTSAFVPWFRKA